MFGLRAVLGGSPNKSCEEAGEVTSAFRAPPQPLLEALRGQVHKGARRSEVGHIGTDIVCLSKRRFKVSEEPSGFRREI